MPYLVWLTIFAIFPMIFMIYYAFTNENGLLTLQNFIDIRNYSKIFVRSIFISILSTFLCFIIGYPTSYAISKLNKKTQKIMISGIILQMWINILLTTYSIMTMLESNGIISKIFSFFGYKELTIINTSIAVIVGEVYSSLPFMILPIYSSLSKLDNKIIEAAQDLGANKITIFSKIILPMSKSGIISGLMMTLSPNMSSFIFSKMLGGNENILIGEVIELKFLGSLYDPWTGSSLAMILVVFIFLCNGIIMSYDVKNN